MQGLDHRGARASAWRRLNCSWAEGEGGGRDLRTRRAHAGRRFLPDRVRYAHCDVTMECRHSSPLWGRWPVGFRGGRDSLFTTPGPRAFLGSVRKPLTAEGLGKVFALLARAGAGYSHTPSDARTQAAGRSSTRLHFAVLQRLGPLALSTRQGGGGPHEAAGADRRTVAQKIRVTPSARA